MKQNVYLIAFLTVCWVNFSCKSNVTKIVEGIWSIDTLLYNQSEIRSCLLSNTVVFDKSGSATLPIAGGLLCPEIKSAKDGEWSIDVSNNNVVLNIISDSSFLNGNYIVHFRRDSINKLLKMEFNSDSIYVVCRKGLFNYDANILLIDELESLSVGRDIK